MPACGLSPPQAGALLTMEGQAHGPIMLHLTLVEKSALYLAALDIIDAGQGRHVSQCKAFAEAVSFHSDKLDKIVETAVAIDAEIAAHPEYHHAWRAEAADIHPDPDVARLALALAKRHGRIADKNSSGATRRLRLT